MSFARANISAAVTFVFVIDVERILKTVSSKCESLTNQGKLELQSVLQARVTNPTRLFVGEISGNVLGL